MIKNAVTKGRSVTNGLAYVALAPIGLAAIVSSVPALANSEDTKPATPTTEVKTQEPRNEKPAEANTKPKSEQEKRRIYEANRKASEAKHKATIERRKEEAKAEQAEREAFLKHERLARELASQKKWPEAIEHQREAVKLQPKDRRVQYELAMLLLRAQKTDEAKPELQKLAGENDQFGNNAKRMLEQIAKTPAKK